MAGRTPAQMRTTGGVFVVAGIVVGIFASLIAGVIIVLAGVVLLVRSA